MVSDGWHRQQSPAAVAMTMTNDPKAVVSEEGRQQRDKAEKAVAELLAAALRQSQKGEESGEGLTSKREDRPMNPCRSTEEGKQQPRTNGDKEAERRLFTKWVSQQGNCLYPSREQKEHMASQMDIPYDRVCKLFANYRRRQHKQQKCTAMAMNGAEKDKENDEWAQRQVEEEEGQHGGERARKIGQTIEDTWSKVVVEQRGAQTRMGRKRKASDGPWPNAVQQPPVPQPILTNTEQMLLTQQHYQQLMLARQQQIYPTHQQMLSNQQQSQPVRSSHNPQLAQPQQRLGIAPPMASPSAPARSVPPNPGQLIAQLMATEQQRNTGNNPLLLLAQHLQKQQQMAAIRMQQQAEEHMKDAIMSGVYELLSAASPALNPMTALQQRMLATLVAQQQRDASMLVPGQLLTANALVQQPPHQFLSPPLTISPANSVHATSETTVPVGLLEQQQQSTAQNCSSSSPCSSSSLSTSPPHPLLLLDPSAGAALDLDLIEKEIAAQHNGLSADEAEAVAVLAGLAGGR